ncbi:hypothetical protein S83_048010, partial [Arachis hypogaea]
MEANYYYSMDEDDSYIEIELDASSSPSPRYNDKDHEFHHHQLRISISSTISLSLQKDDAADDNEPPCMSSPINGDDTTNNNTNTSALMFNNPGIGLIMESNPHKPEAQTTIQRGNHNMDAPSSRKQPNFTTKTRSNGGMTKLLIKFRGINIGAILASLIRPLYQPNNNNEHNKSSSKKHFQCYRKKLVNPTNTRRSNVKKDQGITRSSNNNNNREFEDEIICGSFRSCKKSSRKLEMDLGAIRGIFNAMGMNIADKKEYFGKFDEILEPRCHCLPWFLGYRIAGELSLRVKQLEVRCEMKTKDHAFVTVVATVQYRALADKASDAFYRLSNIRGQIQSYIFDVIRASAPKLELDAVLEQKNDIAKSVEEELEKAMSTYGYQIVQTLIVDIEPDTNVKRSMNEINA